MATNQLFSFIASAVIVFAISSSTTGAYEDVNTSLFGTGDEACTSPYNCGWNEVCFNQKCHKRCESGSNAHCVKDGEKKVYFCENGYTGDPHTRCFQMCNTSWDCRSQEETCRNGLCSSKCDLTRCVTNGTCTIKYHINQCMCPPGTTGNPYRSCKKMCDSDSNCDGSEQCTKYNQCVRLCEPGVCGSNAVCNIKNQRSICTCPEGYTGNPRRNCEKICANDVDCNSFEQCYENKCSKKCHDVPSGTNSWCHLVDHKCVCTCPEGFVGNPYIKCEKSCNVHHDCGEGFSCRKGKCHEHCYCGKGATCAMVNGRNKCFCAPGTTGLAFISCGPICNTDEDCADSEECNAYNQCIPACREFSCASHAVCHVTNHRRTCDCPPALINDFQYDCKKTCKGEKYNEVSEACDTYRDGSPWKIYA